MPLRHPRPGSPAASRLPRVKARVAVTWVILALVFRCRDCLHIHAFLPGIDKSPGMLKASSRGFFRNIACCGVAPRGGGYGEVAIALAAPRQQSGAIYQGRGDSLHRSRRKDAFPGRDGQYRRKPSSRYYPSLCSFHILSLAAFTCCCGFYTQSSRRPKPTLISQSSANRRNAALTSSPSCPR